MKIIKTVLMFLLFSNICLCQTSNNISISFTDATIIDVLLTLEKRTEYSFYFDENWLDTTILISNNFTKTNIEDVLKTILENTEINYFIIDNKIILTKNNAIRGEIPENYFQSMTHESSNNNIVQNETNIPVLQKQYTEKNTYVNRKIYYIGKENPSSLKKNYMLSGYIKDAKTLKPIENLSVYIDGTSINTVTDSKGFYSLNIPKGLNILKIASMGYGNPIKKLVVYGNGTLSFDLYEKLEALNEVVIASNRDDNIRSAEVGVTKIDVKGIKNIPLVLGERDILKVATTLPGIKTAGEGALGYNVRGGKVDQNLILFDDAVLYNPSHFFGIFSAINPFATGSVNIYKGTIPSEFGGRLSSVIDISTKEANTKEFAGEGNIGPVTGNLLLEIPVIKDKAGILIGGRATYSDWVLKSVSEPSIKNSKASFYDVLVKYNHKLNKKNTLQATGYLSNDTFSITSDSVFDYSNRLGSIKWNHTFNDKNRAALQLATTEYKFNIIFDGQLNRNFDFGYTINETQLKLKASYIHSKKHKFSYGASSKLYAINPGEITPLDDASVVESKRVARERGLESAIFISDEYEINKNLLLDLGLRYSTFTALGPSSQNIYTNDAPRSEESVVETREFTRNKPIVTYGGPEFRVSARYALSPSLSIKAGYNKTIQYSHLLSSNTTASPVDSWKLSDLNIEPQRAEQLSLGLFKNFDFGLYETSLEGYYKKIRNLLDFKVGAELLLNENIETELLQGEGKAYGLEFLLKKTRGKFNGWLSYTYSRTFVKLDSEFITNRVNDGNFFPANQDRPHDISIITNYKLTKRYSFSLNFNYQSGRPITYPIGKYTFNNSEQVLYSDRNKFRIPDYYRLDLGVNIEGNHKNVKLAHSFWNISVYNVLGRNNPFSVFFVNEQGEIKGFQSSIFAIPIPTITYNFKF